VDVWAILARFWNLDNSVQSFLGFTALEVFQVVPEMVVVSIFGDIGRSDYFALLLDVFFLPRFLMAPSNQRLHRTLRAGEPSTLGCYSRARQGYLVRHEQIVTTRRDKGK